MNQADFAEQLTEHAATLLASDSSFGAQRDAAEKLYALCLARTGTLSDSDRMLPAGKALSPAGAARCVTDFRRTVCYLQGVRAAIDAALSRQPHRPLRVVYAGCGPFASLILPLARRYASAEVVFTLIDAHADALDAAVRLLKFAGMDSAVIDAHCADAATIKLAPASWPHVLIAEVMQRALSREPQLAVTANLVAQAQPDAILVPHRITVDAVLVRVAAEQLSDQPRLHVPLGRLMDVTAASAAALVEQQRDGKLPPIHLQAPLDAPEGLELSLRTEIETAPGIVLRAYDSGITYPEYLFGLGRIPPGARLVCQYRLGADPGFECRLQSES